MKRSYYVEDLKIELVYQTHLASTFSFSVPHSNGKFINQVIFGLERFKDFSEVQLRDNSVYLFNSRRQRLIPQVAYLNVYQTDLPDKRGQPAVPLLVSIPLKSHQLTINEENALKNFDELYIIDTNLPKLTKGQIFACLPYKLSVNEVCWEAQPLDEPIFMFPVNEFNKNHSGFHEQASCLGFIEWLEKQRNLTLPNSYRIGLISDKNPREQFQFEINLGLKNLIGNSRIEKPFELIYISSSNKSSNPFCELFSNVDSDSKASLNKRIEENGGDSFVKSLLEKLKA